MVLSGITAVKLTIMANIRESKLISSFETWLRLEKLSELFVKEYKFHEKRKWRFDYANLEHKIAVELDDITHFCYWNRIKSDCEKLNTAQIQGWKVLRFTNNFREFSLICDLLNSLKC